MEGGSRLKRLTLRLDDGLYEAARREGAEWGVSVSMIARFALRYLLNIGGLTALVERGTVEKARFKAARAEKKRASK